MLETLLELVRKRGDTLLEISDWAVPNDFLEQAVIGIRNAFNGTDNSDTKYVNGMLTLGKKDLKLAQTLIGRGTDESKFLRQIPVLMVINAPRYWWLQMDTYKVGTVKNSQSTMHTILRTPFVLENFSLDDTSYTEASNVLRIVQMLNSLRAEYLNSHSHELWRSIIAMLPQSYNQKATWTANYQVLRNIYFARRDHKLSEWHTFCREIERLPYAKELICYDG